MTDALVIVGAGGFARETASAARAAGAWELAGFVDDNPDLHGCDIGGLTVRGGLAAVHDMAGVKVVVCPGSPRDYGVRRRLVGRLDLPVHRYAVVRHPAAEVGDGCTIGAGSVLLAGVVLTAEVTVGAHVAVMPQAVLTHGDVVEDYVTIASGVRLGGGVRLCSGAYIGAGAMIREQCTVGAGSLIGMGSVVLHDIGPGQVWAGNPARHIRDTTIEHRMATTGGARR